MNNNNNNEIRGFRLGDFVMVKECGTILQLEAWAKKDGIFLASNNEDEAWFVEPCDIETNPQIDAINTINQSK